MKGFDLSEATPEEVFAGVKNELVQLVGPNSTVADEIGSDFDFVNDASTIKTVVGGTEISATAAGENTYNFNDTEGNTLYTLTYYPDGTTHEEKTYGECFIWKTNVSVTKDKPVQVKYQVKLTDPSKTGGLYGTYDMDGSEGYGSLYTNNIATLYPIDSTGAKGESEDFNKPTVSYIAVEKIWDDSDNKDGKRPDYVTVKLKMDGADTGKSVVLNKDDGWVGYFTDLPEGEHQYEVTEDTVEGYADPVIDGFKITNKIAGEESAPEESSTPVPVYIPPVRIPVPNTGVK